jgi:hypothetical protein
MIKELKGQANRDPSKLPRGLLFQPDPSKNKEAGYQQKHGHVGRHVDHPWRHLYRQPSNLIIQAAILNQHFEYMQEYCERGNSSITTNGGWDINAKDFSGWTPLHCASYLGQTKYIKYLIMRPNVLLSERNDEGKTPVLLAIEAGNVFDEDNATMLLLQRGAELEEDIWHKLLILSLNYDIVGYMKLAFRLSIPLHYPQDESKISLHKAVCCHAVKILKFYADTFAP